MSVGVTYNPHSVDSVLHLSYCYFSAVWPYGLTRVWRLWHGRSSLESILGVFAFSGGQLSIQPWRSEEQAIRGLQIPPDADWLQQGR